MNTIIHNYSYLWANIVALDPLLLEGKLPQCRVVSELSLVLGSTPLKLLKFLHITTFHNYHFILITLSGVTRVKFKVKINTLVKYNFWSKSKFG